jgi:hypothetical protein
MSAASAVVRSFCVPPAPPEKTRSNAVLRLLLSWYAPTRKWHPSGAGVRVCAPERERAYARTCTPLSFCVPAYHSLHRER